MFKFKFILYHGSIIKFKSNCVTSLNIFQQFVISATLSE